MKATLLLPALLAAVTTVASGEDPAPAPPVASKAAAEPARPSARYNLGTIDAYISRIAGGFSITGRDTGPFGLPQDPSSKPKAPRVVRATPKLRNIPPTPFRDVVSALRVSAVLPSSQQFLVGSRTFRKGDRFPILYRDKSVNVQVTRVSSNSITFRNLTTNEVADLELSLRPAGMTRDSGGGSGLPGPPGLERDNPTAPLHVDVAPPITDATSR